MPANAITKMAPSQNAETATLFPDGLRGLVQPGGFCQLVVSPSAQIESERCVEELNDETKVEIVEKS